MGSQSKTMPMTRKEIRAKARRMARAFKSEYRRNLVTTRRLFGKKAAVSGRTVWRGPSQLDPSKWVRVVLSNYVRPSENIKTGPMLQVAIFTDEEWEAMAYEICGNCPHGKDATEKGKRAACYVQWDRIKGAWEASHSNRALTLRQGSDMCHGMKVRFGMAGDPMAVPLYVWKMLLSKAKGVTGYTHQWYRTMDPMCPDYFRGYETIFMASVDSPEQGVYATRHGWRWFAVQSDPSQDYGDATPCKALPETEGGKDLACSQCLLCGPIGKKNIVIPAHGPGKGNVKALSIGDLYSSLGYLTVE